MRPQACTCCVACRHACMQTSVFLTRTVTSIMHAGYEPAVAASTTALTLSSAADSVAAAAKGVDKLDSEAELMAGRHFARCMR